MDLGAVFVIDLVLDKIPGYREVGPQIPPELSSAPYYQINCVHKI